MQPKQEHRASHMTHTKNRLVGSNISLDDIKIFVAIATYGSLRKAADASGKNPNYFARRLKSFEHQYRANLFRRSRSGMILTKDGSELFSIASNFIAQSKEVLNFIRSRNKQKRQTSIVGVTEGIGTFWLMPRLVELQQNNPSIFIDFRCQMQPANVGEYGVDISVQIEKPDDDEMIISRIGYLHIMLFASVDYVNKHGAPQGLEDLKNFRIVEQRSEQVDASEYINSVSDNPVELISMRTNTSSSHAYAIARGAGIGPLPSYARAITKRLIPVCDAHHIRREIYLVHQRDTGKKPHHRKILNWLRRSFDSKKFPWFASEFVHPNDFEHTIRTGNIVQMFDGFDR